MYYLHIPNVKNTGLNLKKFGQHGIECKFLKMLFVAFMHTYKEEQGWKRNKFKSQKKKSSMKNMEHSLQGNS